MNSLFSFVSLTSNKFSLDQLKAGEYGKKVEITGERLNFELSIFFLKFHDINYIDKFNILMYIQGMNYDIIEYYFVIDDDVIPNDVNLLKEFCMVMLNKDYGIKKIRDFEIKLVNKNYRQENIVMENLDNKKIIGSTEIYDEYYKKYNVVSKKEKKEETIQNILIIRPIQDYSDVEEYENLNYIYTKYSKNRILDYKNKIFLTIDPLIKYLSPTLEDYTGKEIKIKYEDEIYYIDLPQSWNQMTRKNKINFMGIISDIRDELISLRSEGFITIENKSLNDNIKNKVIENVLNNTILDCLCNDWSFEHIRLNRKGNDISKYNIIKIKKNYISNDGIKYSPKKDLFPIPSITRFSIWEERESSKISNYSSRFDEDYLPLLNNLHINIFNNYILDWIDRYIDNIKDGQGNKTMENLTPINIGGFWQGNDNDVMSLKAGIILWNYVSTFPFFSRLSNFSPIGINTDGSLDLLFKNIDEYIHFKNIYIDEISNIKKKWIIYGGSLLDLVEIKIINENIKSMIFFIGDNPFILFLLEHNQNIITELENNSLEQKILKNIKNIYVDTDEELETKYVHMDMRLKGYVDYNISRDNLLEINTEKNIILRGINNHIIDLFD